MRLSPQELEKIKTVFEKYKTVNSKIYLFGSRTHSEKKGGDIDLLITFFDKTSLIEFKRLDFIVELKKQLGDRKIDATLATQVEMQLDPFLKTIADEAIAI